MLAKQGVFVVTGGVSGLGKATVEALLLAGARVVAFDRNTELGTRLSEQFSADRFRFVSGSVTTEGDVQRALSEATAAFGQIDGAVNCAGIELAERVVGRSGVHALDSFTNVINVNLVGTFNVVRLAAEAMASNAPNTEGERGVIVNTASIAAYDGQIGQAAYAASKAGIAGMTLPLARDLAKLGIRVVAIAPGVFDTPLMARFSDPVRQSLEQLVPFPPRLGRPEEFARLVVHVIENVMLNGTVIRLDGALRMPPR